MGNIEVWKWDPPPTVTKIPKDDIYLIPGFPGSSLDNALLAQQLLLKGYSVKLINPPGHGKSEIDNNHWRFQFDQYGRSLYELDRMLSASSPVNKNLTIVAHSAGAEMVLKLLLLQAKKGNLPKQSKIVLINPWLPSLSNYPIPWSEDDENILKYSPLVVKLFGPLSKDSTYKRLFSDPSLQKNVDYLNAHEKFTENLDGWGTFNNSFVTLLKSTTRTQKEILKQGANYPLSQNDLVQLRKKLRLANIKILIINSSGDNDKIIPTTYKLALKKAIKTKLPEIKVRFIEIPKGGHMLQIEHPKQIVDAIITTP